MALGVMTSDDSRGGNADALDADDLSGSSELFTCKRRRVEGEVERREENEVERREENEVERLLHLSGAECAESLVGCELVRRWSESESSRCRIVETEYYCSSDEASHSYGGSPTARTAVMFKGCGYLYVYRSYGLHHCMNVTCATPGSAVLIRALEPLSGVTALRKHRPKAREVIRLTNGPGNLCQALNVTMTHNGLDLFDPNSELHLEPRTSSPTPLVRSSPRVGITKAKHKPWRFFEHGSPYLSRTK